MKKTIFSIVIGIFVGTMANVLASSMLASNIQYTPKDSKWNVNTVDAAIDSLYYYDTIKTPVGEIINYMGTIVPEHYLECDGKTYKISDYPILAEHIKTNFGSYNKFGGDGTTTFAVPDLRGEFLRGSGTNSHANQGSGVAVGTHQDASKLATMYFSNALDVMYKGQDSSSVVGEDSRINTTSHLTKQIVLNNSSWSTNEPQYKTLRPTNTSVMYAIRYE